MREILVTGGQGQIGLELARVDWPADVAVHFPTREELDIGDGDSVARYFEGRSFAAAINSAAYTAVDNAEKDEETAFRVNAKRSP